MISLILEALFVSILNLFFGNLITFKNKNISLLVSGFVIHIFCELVRINKYYCKHGVACNN